MSGKVECLREEGFVDCDSDPESDWMLEAAVGGTDAADPVAVDVGAVLPATLPCSCHGCRQRFYARQSQCDPSERRSFPDPSISSRRVL